MGPNSFDEALHGRGYRQVPLGQTYSEFLHCAAQRKRKEPLFDTAAIDGILKKVGSKYWKSPLDSEALAQELEHACNHFWIWDECDHEPSKKQLIGRLNGFLKIITRLILLRQ
jgi:hypothetical protein